MFRMDSFSCVQFPLAMGFIPAEESASGRGDKVEPLPEAQGSEETSRTSSTTNMEGTICVREQRRTMS